MASRATVVMDAAANEGRWSTFDALQREEGREADEHDQESTQLEGL